MYIRPCFVILPCTLKESNANKFNDNSYKY